MFRPKFQHFIPVLDIFSILVACEEENEGELPESDQFEKASKLPGKTDKFVFDILNTSWSMIRNYLLCLILLNIE